MQVWVKNYNASNTIDMQVLPQFENLFSANGYLGEAPQLSATWGEYNNYKQVGLIYIPATTENLSLADHKGLGTGTFAINGYTEA